MPLSLQQITDAWGQWMANKYSGSGGVKFTASTNYGARSELKQYHQYQVSSNFNSITYDPRAPLPPTGAQSSVVTSYNNNSSVAQSYTFEQEMQTQQSFTWSVTEQLQIGVSVTATAGVPEVASVSTTVSTQLTLSSTQGSTSTKTQTWKVSQPIICPPYAHVDATMVVTTQDYNINWTGSCDLRGNVAIWFNNKVALNPNDYHWLWFPSIVSVFSDCRNNNICDLTGYQIAADRVIALCSGNFSGGQGIGVSINVKETTLGPTAKSAAVAAQGAAIQSVVHTIPVSIDGVHGILGVSP